MVQLVKLPRHYHGCAADLYAVSLLWPNAGSGQIANLDNSGTIILISGKWPGLQSPNRGGNEKECRFKIPIYYSAELCITFAGGTDHIVSFEGWTSHYCLSSKTSAFSTTRFFWKLEHFFSLSLEWRWLIYSHQSTAFKWFSICRMENRDKPDVSKDAPLSLLNISICDSTSATWYANLLYGWFPLKLGSWTQVPSSQICNLKKIDIYH